MKYVLYVRTLWLNLTQFCIFTADKDQSFVNPLDQTFQFMRIIVVINSITFYKEVEAGLLVDVKAFDHSFS